MQFFHGYIIILGCAALSQGASAWKNVQPYQQVTDCKHCIKNKRECKGKPMDYIRFNYLWISCS